MKIIVRALVAAACLHFLASCGGAVSQDNASSKEFFTLQPGTAEAFSGVEMAFTITGGQPPYTGSSSNALVAPIATSITTKTFSIVPQYTTAVVPVVISIFDSAGKSVEAKLNVNPNIISNNVKITPLTGSGAPDCGSSVCSGSSASLVMTLASATLPVANRPVRFDVEQGAFAFVQGQQGSLTAPSFTTSTDASGRAFATIRADALAPSQLAVVRLTDIVSGSVLLVNFTILRITNGATVITVLPSSVKLTGEFKGICTANVNADFFVTGGTAPYLIGSTFDVVASVVTPTILTNEGRFTARTGGACGTTLFTITDSRGLTVTATLEAVEGADKIPVILLLPTTGTLGCGETATFTIAGGLPPFVVSSTSSKVRTTLSGRIVTATRLAGDINNPATTTPVNVFITVSDGASNAQAQLSVADDCTP